MCVLNRYTIRHFQVEGEGTKKQRAKEVFIEIIDVGGQKGERKQWDRQIELADAILYVPLSTLCLQVSFCFALRSEKTRRLSKDATK